MNVGEEAEDLTGKQRHRSNGSAAEKQTCKKKKKKKKSQRLSAASAALLNPVEVAGSPVETASFLYPVCSTLTGPNLAFLVMVCFLGLTCTLRSCVRVTRLHRFPACADSVLCLLIEGIGGEGEGATKSLLGCLPQGLSNSVTQSSASPLAVTPSPIPHPLTPPRSDPSCKGSDSSSSSGTCIQWDHHSASI